MSEPTHKFTCPACHGFGGPGIRGRCGLCDGTGVIENADPALARVVVRLEQFRRSGAEGISFSALMHDGDDTLAEAVAAAARKVGYAQ